jgi:hypothetical protein
MGFQTAVNSANPIGVEGDFADANPRASAYAGEGALVAGPNGVTVGTFGWILADGVTVVNVNPGTAAPDGYIHREQQGLITVYLAESSNLVPVGFPVTLMTAGGFLAKVRGIASTRGAQVFASNADGTPYIGAAPGGGGVLTNFLAKSVAPIGSITAISTW